MRYFGKLYYLINVKNHVCLETSKEPFSIIQCIQIRYRLKKIYILRQTLIINNCSKLLLTRGR